MLELTKTPPINNLLVSFTIPRDKHEEVLKLVGNLGYQAKIEPEYISFNEILKENEAQTLASCLRDLRYREDMAQEELAEKAGI